VIVFDWLAAIMMVETPWDRRSQPARNITMSTATATLDRLHHVAISVPNIAEAVDWYRATFACEVTYQDATWALLKFANVGIALVIPEQHPPHLGFVTPNACNYGQLKRHRDGTESIYISDPAGNAVELLSPESCGEA
jgi:catechol 2,3-dioxygenase-like lactoylglutathione lyase family enzyme